MKKTQLTDAFRNIRKRIVSYLSICLVIMLGVGAFLATRYMETGIIREAAGYFRERSFKDFELISSLGASEKSIAAIKAVEGVTDAEGVMEYDGSLQKGDLKRNVTVLSRTEHVSVPMLTDGKMPVSAAECAIGEDLSEQTGIAVGDRVVIYLKSSAEGDPLLGHEYTVTGLIKHPDYVHRKLTDTVVLPLEAFDMSVTDNAYMRVFVRAEDVSLDDYFTQAYFDQTAGTRSALKELAVRLQDDRANEVRDEAYAEIDSQWAEAEAELAEAEAEIDANELDLDSALSDARSALENAEIELADKIGDYSDQISAGESAIASYEKKLADAKKKLKTAKKAYEKAKAEYEAKTGWMVGALEDIDKLQADQDGSAPLDDKERRETELDLAKKLIDNEDTLNMIADSASDENAEALMPEFAGLVGKKKSTSYIDSLKKLLEDVELEGEETESSKTENDGEQDESDRAHAVVSLLIDRARAVRDDETGATHFSEAELALMKEVFEVFRSDDVQKRFDKAAAEISSNEKKLADGEKQLKEKKAELKEAKAKLKSEKAGAEKKIRDGWSEYYSKKASYESKIEEARELLAENREEAEKKLSEAKAEVGDIKCEWVVLDRNANAGYIDVKVQLDSLRSTGLVFGVLFLLITALVCFSTLTIIIEEQKKLIGTVKAFGFHKSEVLFKYLIFGVSAGIAGDILAVFTGLGLSEIVQTVYSATNIYQYGRPATVMRPVPTIVISLAMILVCAVASVIACSDVLRKPASALMSGQTLKSGTRKRSSVSSKRGGSLYSRLILRNISDDKARVIVSTAIVAFCCMLMGVGLSFKLATTGMLAKQEGDVNLFDIRMDVGSSVTDDQYAAMTGILDENGVSYAEAMYESCLFNTGNTISGMNVLAGDPGELAAYYGMDDAGSPAEVTSEGVLIPVRMSENYGYGKGDSISILDTSMISHNAAVTGTYTCYFGRTAVTTPEGYSAIFGEEFSPNSCFIHLNGADAQALKNALLDVSDDISFEASSDFRTSFESVGALYNIIVFVTMGVAVFMSFMILTNLANIFLTRKKNELIVMRVIGFSIRQTRAYLAREAVLTTLVGLALGILAGSLLTPFAVRILEPADLQFDRSYHAIAWVVSAGIEGLFALIIYSTVFSRVKHFNLKDIAS